MMTAATQGPAGVAGIRIDKLLWFLRLATTRGFAQQWAITGHIRLNGRRVERASVTVRAGDVLVLPIRDMVRVIEVIAIPLRRGPSPEALACYRYVDSTDRNGGEDDDDDDHDHRAGLTGAP
jgi:ribosome-associated heat shock protein Hsp15